MKMRSLKDVMKRIAKLGLVAVLAAIMFPGPVFAEGDSSVSYIDASGATKSRTEYTVLSGSTETGTTLLEEGWYVVPANTTVSYAGELMIPGGNTVNLILCDGATLSLDRDTGTCISGYSKSKSGTTLNIYGQSRGNSAGKLVATSAGNITMLVENLTVNGGELTVTYTGESTYDAIRGKVVMNGGKLTAESKNTYAIMPIDGKDGETNVDFKGGNFIAKTTNDSATNQGIAGIVTLNYTNATDTFFATGWGTDKLTIADGKAFTDGHSNVLLGTINNYKDQTLYPAAWVEKMDPIGGGMSCKGSSVWKLSELTPETKATVTVWNNSPGWLPSITVTKASGGTIPETDITRSGPATHDGKTYTFEFPMPDENVTVTATFERAPITGTCGDPAVNGGKNVIYTLTDEDKDDIYDKLVISGTGAMKDYAPIDNTPPWYGDYKGTIKTLEIEAGVTRIGNYAFYQSENKDFTSVTIPENVTSIGDGAFSSCKNLASIRILGKLTTIGENPFWTGNNGTMVYAPAVNATGALKNACYDDHNSPAGITYICTEPTLPKDPLTYNGSEQTVFAAPANCGYTLSGNKGTKVGSYTATATLNPGGTKGLSGTTKYIKYFWGNVNAPDTWAAASDREGKEYTWRMVTKYFGDKDVTVTIDDQTYTGSPIEPDITVKIGSYTLKKDTDFIVKEWSNNTNVGTATVTIEGKEKNCSGRKTATFAIVPKPVVISGITAKDKDYDGKTTAELDFTGVKFEGKLDGDELIVKATGNFANENAGEGKTVNITGFTLGGRDASNYKPAEAGNQMTTTATIRKVASSVTGVPTAKTGLTYTGSAMELIAAGSATGGRMYYAVTTENTAPAADRYSEALPAATDVGTYYVWYKVVGDANHNDSDAACIQVTIKEAPANVISITKASVSGIKNKTYTGSVITQNLTVKINGKKLTEGKDYTVSYRDNTDVGTATVIITGKGGYKDTKKVTFKIEKRKITNASVTGVIDKAFTGKAITQKPVVVVNNITLKKGRDYTLSYQNNVKAGTATVTVKGKGNYSGTRTLHFRILKAANTLKVRGKTASIKASKLKSRNGAISVSKVCTITRKGKGTLKYKKESGDECLSISSKGKVTVAKGTAKGVYKMNVKVTAAGTANYESIEKHITVKVKVE
ncbi:MAG: leucine-rich repeat protein [Lachnospiraceae bacterium]|nr:leucine-rich repeat protein [Lachnospiraceae bacterium]